MWSPERVYLKKATLNFSSSGQGKKEQSSILMDSTSMIYQLQQLSKASHFHAHSVKGQNVRIK